MHKKTRKTRKHARKDNPAKKHRRHARKDNPTKKRARARKGRKTHTHRTAKTVQRSVVAYSSHPRKKNPARRRRSGRKTAFKRAVTRAKRVKNPGRKRHGRRHHMARYDNPTHKKHSRRHYGRRRNPAKAGVGMATAGYMDMAIIGLSVAGGMILADIVDRFVATRAGAAGKPFYGAGAIVEISAPPDGMRLAAQGGLSILSIVGSAMLYKRGMKKSAEVLAGVGIGAGAHAFLQIWNDKVIGSIFKSDPAVPESIANRLYPDLQSKDLDAAAAAATALRNKTTGVPQNSRVSAPAPQRAVGPQGAPRVVSAPSARPAPSTVGCGAPDMQTMMALKAAQQRISQLEAQMSNATAAPPADHVDAPAPSNVSPITSRLSRFA